jgi:hypothetical protein
VRRLDGGDVEHLTVDGEVEVIERGSVREL